MTWDVPSAAQIRTAPSAPAVTGAPPGRKATAFTGPRCGSSGRLSPPASGQIRAVPSQEAEASDRPSGETARATIGPVWPSSTRSGSARPRRQRAIRPSSEAVAKRPSGSAATAFTAPSWKRSTPSAAPVSRAHTMADWSKPPEIARRPSAVTASARTGPPWPRICARAGAPQSSRTAITPTIRAKLVIGAPLQMDRPAIAQSPPPAAAVLAAIGSAFGRRIQDGEP